MLRHHLAEEEKPPNTLIQQKEIKTFVDKEIQSKVKEVVHMKVSKLFQEFARKKEDEDIKAENEQA